jgi:hypothetical protein
VQLERFGVKGSPSKLNILDVAEQGVAEVDVKSEI